MATYSSAPAQSIIRYSYKDSAFSGTSFTKTLATVGENEQYDLLQLHAIAQDGNIGYFNLYGDYGGIVDDSGNDGQGIEGYSYYAYLNVFNSDGPLDVENTQNGVNLSDLDYSEFGYTGLSDQNRVFVNSYGPRLLSWRQGAVIKLRYSLSDFTPANEEFFDVDIWLRKTVYNG